MAHPTALLRTVAGLALCGLASPAGAEFFDGKLLLDLLSAQESVDRGKADNLDYSNIARANGYVLGVVDAVIRVELCPNETITAGELTKLVEQYLRAHPEALTLSGDVSVIAALKPVIPCPPRP